MKRLCIIPIIIICICLISCVPRLISSYSAKVMNQKKEKVSYTASFEDIKGRLVISFKKQTHTEGNIKCDIQLTKGELKLFYYQYYLGADSMAPVISIRADHNPTYNEAFGYIESGQTYHLILDFNVVSSGNVYFYWD